MWTANKVPINDKIFRRASVRGTGVNKLRHKEKSSNCPEEAVLLARQEKLKPYLEMLEEIMEAMPERKRIAGHLFRLLVMTETKDLEAAISVHEWLEEKRKPQLQVVKDAARLPR